MPPGPLDQPVYWHQRQGHTVRTSPQPLLGAEVVLQSVGPSKEDASHNFASLLFRTYIHPQWCPLGTWELWLCYFMVYTKTLARPIRAVRGELCAWTRCVASLQLLPERTLTLFLSLHGMGDIYRSSLQTRWLG